MKKLLVTFFYWLAILSESIDEFVGDMNHTVQCRLKLRDHKRGHHSPDDLVWGCPKCHPGFDYESEV